MATPIGSGSGVNPVTYRFDAPFTIVSGLAQASISEGNTTLSLPGSAFHDGILRFDGPISSLGVDSNAVTPAYQVMTLAVASPEPGAAATALAALATLLGVVRRSGATLRAAAPLFAALLALGSAAPSSAGVFGIPCSPGSASPSGFRPCTACAPGSFASEEGATQCQPCPSGTYADEAGSASCELDICGDEPIPVSWISTVGGSAGDITVTIEGLLNPSLHLGSSEFRFQGPDFAAGPLCSTSGQLSYQFGSDWTATLEEPVRALLVYAKVWRGPYGDFHPVTYRFDAPFTIASGLTQASVSEDDTLLSLPVSVFHDGILRFDGPISSLGVDTNITGGGSQRMTLAVETPEPGAAATALAALATLIAVVRRRSVRMACSILPVLAIASGAGAAGVVGNGTPESCTGSAFAAALVDGGLVTFDCGATPKTIVVDTAVVANGRH